MRQSILRYFISLLLVSLCICSATSIFIISGSMKEDSEREMMYSVKLIEYNLDYSGDLNKQIETLNPLAFSDDTRISVIDEKGKVLADTYKNDISSNHLKRYPNPFSSIMCKTIGTLLEEESRKDCFV